MYGKNVWMIADGYMSDTVKGEYVSHEAICVLNVSGKDANINITLYFEGCWKNIKQFWLKPKR